MATLLHVDSSFNSERSVSREVTAAFAEQWKLAHPDGRYIYRDLAAHPVPHLDAVAAGAARTPPEQQTPEQAAQWALSQELIGEVLAADTIVIGVPMYNFSVPTTLRAWLDRIVIPRFFVNPETGKSELSAKKVVVMTARGGSYAPGTPRAPFDFQEPYLKAVLKYIGLDGDLTFVNTELTMAAVVPALAQFKDLAATSRQNAHQAARQLASV